MNQGFVNNIDGRVLTVNELVRDQNSTPRDIQYETRKKCCEISQVSKKIRVFEKIINGSQDMRSKNL